MTFEKVVKILAEYKGCAKEDITMDTTFEALGLDSLDTVEVAMSFEEEFNISLNIDGSIKAVKDLVDLIEKAQG